MLPSSSEGTAWLPGSLILAPAPGNARKCTARNLRQRRRGAWTALSAPANLLSRVNVDAQGGLDFLSVNSLDVPPLGLENPTRATRPFAGESGFYR